jgi:tetratricopeptide (TPR) repeat protein
MNYWNTAVGMGLIQLFNCEYAKAADWFDNYSESMPDPILPRALRILTTLRLWSEAERRVKARAGQLDTLEAEQDRKSLADLLKDLTDLINDSLKVCPTHPELLTLKGHAFLATGQPDEAIAAFQAALKADAGFNLANYGLGRAYLAKGDADKAIETLKAYTLGQAKPLLTAGVHIGFARAYALKNDVEQALKSYAAAIALDPSTELLLERSAFFAKIKKSSEAESDLSFILQTQPDHLDARLARIDLYLETGDRVKALADVEKAEQINASKKLGRDAAIKEKRAAAEKLTPK